MFIVDETEKYGLSVREFTVETERRPVTGALWQQRDARPGAPLVCLGHGASGDRHQAPIPWLCRRLVGEHGFVALSIDGPVHGRRRVGDGGRKAFWPEWERPGSAQDMVADWKATLDAVQSRPEVGAGPVGYWGLSMGTIYGAPFVAADPRIVVAVLGLMGITGPENYRPIITTAARSIDVPILFLMQLEDELFTRDEYLALFDTLASPDKRIHANPGLHPAVPIEELHHCVDFLVARLTGEPADRTPSFTVSD